MHGRRGAVRWAWVPDGPARLAVVPRRSGAAGRQLPLHTTGLGSRGADDVPRRCFVIREPPGDAVRRPVERRRLRDLRSDRHRDLGGDVRGRRGPAGRHHLQACVPGGADVLGRQRDTVAERPDHQLHIHPACNGDRRRSRLCTRRDGDVRSVGCLLGRCVERRHLHGDRLHGRARWRRHLHDRRRPERLDRIRSGPTGAAVVHRRPRGTGDRLHLRAAGSRCGRRCRLHRRGRRDVRVDGDVQYRPGEQRYLLGRGRRRVAPVGWDVHGLRGPGRRRGACGRKPRRTKLHDRCRSGEHEPADDQLHVGGAGGRGDRRQLHACGVGELGPAGRLHGRPDERRRVRPLRRGRVVRRDGHVPGARRPGG